MRCCVRMRSVPVSQNFILLHRQEKGQEAAIVNAVSAIDTCFREPVGKLQCTKIQAAFDEDEPKPKGLFGF